MKNIGWLLAAGAAYIGYKLYTTANELSYRATSITIDSANTNLLKSTVDVTIRVSNPNDQSLTFTRFAGSLINNGTQIAQIDVNAPVTIAAKSQTDITFPVQISNLSVVAQILDMLIRKTSPMVTLNGVLTAGSFQVPISQTLPVTGASGIGNIPPAATRINAGLFCLAEY